MANFGGVGHTHPRLHIADHPCFTGRAPLTVCLGIRHPIQGQICPTAFLHISSAQFSHQAPALSYRKDPACYLPSSTPAAHPSKPRTSPRCSSPLGSSGGPLSTYWRCTACHVSISTPYDFSCHSPAVYSVSNAFCHIGTGLSHQLLLREDGHQSSRLER